MGDMTPFFQHALPVTGGTSSKSKRRKPVILHREFSKIRSLAIDERFVWFSEERLLTKANFPCLETISIIVYNKTSLSLLKGNFGLEVRQRPQEPERSAQTVLWVEKWIKAMEDLAKKEYTNRPAPEIRFVDLVSGSRSKDAKDKAAEIKEAMKEDRDEVVEELAEPRIEMGGTLES
jgi:hypothetical protein